MALDFKVTPQCLFPARKPRLLVDGPLGSFQRIEPSTFLTLNRQRSHRTGNCETSSSGPHFRGRRLEGCAGGCSLNARSSIYITYVSCRHWFDGLAGRDSISSSRTRPMLRTGIRICVRAIYVLSHPSLSPMAGMVSVAYARLSVPRPRIWQRGACSWLNMDTIRRPYVGSY